MISAKEEISSPNLDNLHRPCYLDFLVTQKLLFFSGENLPELEVQGKVLSLLLFLCFFSRVTLPDAGECTMPWLPWFRC